MGHAPGQVLTNISDFYRDRDQNRLALADAYRKNQIDHFEATGKNIQDVLSAGQVLDPKTQQLRPLTPEETQNLTQAQQQITKHIQNLYNPSFDPATGFAAESPLHKLTDMLHITKPPQQGKTKPEQMADLQGIVAKYEQPVPGTEQARKSQEQSAAFDRDVQDHMNAIKKYFPNATPEQQEQFKREYLEQRLLGRPKSPNWKLYKLPDGTTHYFDQNRPDEIPEGAQPISLSAANPHVKLGSVEDFIKRAYGDNPTSEQLKKGLAEYAQAKAVDTVGTRQIVHDNGDGTATIYEITSTTSKVAPGVSTPQQANPTASPSASGKSPRVAKKAGPEPTAGTGGKLKPGQVIAGRMPTREQTKLDAMEDVRPSLNELIEVIEKNGLTDNDDLIPQWKNWLMYKAGKSPGDPVRGEIIKAAAALQIMGAAPWVTIGRGKYMFDQIIVHLPSPTDTTKQLYEKATWLRDNLIDPQEKLIKTRTLRPQVTTEDPSHPVNQLPPP